MNKLEMQWQGPYVIKKVRENDYVIDLDGQNKMFHANMLRKYNTRKPVEEGMLFLCGSRHIEIVVGGVAECDPVSSDNHEYLGLEKVHVKT